MNRLPAPGCRASVRAPIRAGTGWSVALALVAGTVWGTAAAEVRDPNGVAVIIGNRDYGKGRVPEVAFAHRDAEAFKRYVLDVLGYDPANVIDLRDASQAQMMGAFGNRETHKGKVWRYLDPDGGSDVVVFYSGHGVPGQKDRRGYLLPADADPGAVEINGYPIDLLYENLGKLEEAREVRVYLDACFSGDSHRGMLIRAASPVAMSATPPVGTEGLTVLTAASGAQLASWDEEAGHGLFTHHLLDALYGKGNACRTYEGGEWKERSGRSWRNPGFSQTDGHPVVCVNWTDAKVYVGWLSGKTGEGYRLLSESEWEYVARAGTGTARYWWGDEIGRNRANCDGCGSRWDNRQTAPVGSFSANGFGLYDVHGNVWEWVEDCRNESYAGAPTDGSAWESGDCSRRVLRGGSWGSGAGDLRSANRT